MASGRHTVTIETVKSSRFKLTIKTFRKSPGGKRDGRSGETGKLGVITDFTTGEVLHCIKAPTLKALTKELRRLANIPPSVRIERDETIF